MRMADFAITVSRMTGNVMSVYMSMFVAVVVTTTAFVTVSMSVFMFMSVVMSAAAFVTMCVSMFVLMFATMLMSVIMLITIAAIIYMLMGMFFTVMFMIVATAAFVTMSMLGNMSHSFVIMILTAVTAGAAFRMLAVILYTIDMAVNMTKCSYIAGTVTDIFQIFLHCIYHLSFQVVSLFI